MQKNRVKVSGFLFGSLAFLLFANQNARGEKWTSEDIVKYEKISPRLAVAYGDRGQALGIYDLSYIGPESRTDNSKGENDPDWLSFGELNFDTALETWKRESKSHRLNDKNGIKAISSLKKWSESKTRMSQTMTLKSFLESERILSGNNKDAAESTLKKLMKSISLVSGTESIHSDLTNVDSSQNEMDLRMLSDLRFRFDDRKIIFEMKRPKAEVPFLVGDFKETRKIFGRSMGYAAYQTAMKAVMGLIEIPYLSPLIDTFFSRLFKFLNANIQAHEMALFGSLTDCETLKDSLNPVENLNLGLNSFLCGLPENDRKMLMKTAYMGTELSVAGLKDLVLNVDKMVESKIRKEKKRMDESVKYFSKKRYEVIKRLGPYVIAKSKHVDAGLYLMNEPKWWGVIQKPDLAIDYKHLSTPYIIRMGLIINSPGIEYGLRFVPYVGGTVAGFYSGTIEKPFYSALEYEFRMLTYLEGREADLGEDFALEKATLYKQNVNPFDPGLKKTERWIKEWSKLLNIH